MIDAKQFNLLSHVEKKSWLSAKMSLSIVIIYALLLIFLYVTMVVSTHEVNQKIITAKDKSAQSVLQLEQYLTEKGELAAVLPSLVVLDSQGFYKEFKALSDLNISGLWLTRIIIDRDKHYVKITGDMTSTDKLNQLLNFLGENEMFKEYHFKGIEVSEEFLPKITKSLRKQASELKIPKIYHFVVQTTSIKKKNSGSRK